MVPEGWINTKLGDLGRIKSGATPLRSEGNRYFSDSGHPWVKTMDLTNGEIVSTNECITDVALKETSCSIFPKGTVLVAMYGGFNQIGRTGLLAKPSAINQAISAIQLDQDKANSQYVLAFLNGHVTRWKRFAASSRKDPNITRDDVVGFPILLPPLPEQKKIAQILSTWDQAITATERLLESSQQRKKGLMQQLLTGKKRLPGFEGEWKKVELGEALAYQQPTPFLVTSTEYSDDFPTPVLTAGKSFLLGYTDETFGIYDDGLPVIIFDDFTTASQFVDFPFKAKSSAMKILTAKPGYSIRFIFEAMRMIRFAVGGHQRHWISIFANLVIPCPSSEEQHAISEVCATADREISSLQARLDSLKSEKKALMQQLLTGKRRVQVDTEAA